jgi:hypothetical protein
MSAGNNGAGMPPDHDDDPFAYLYRPEGDAAGGQPQPPPRQPASYHQVRPVGERTYGGQTRQGQGYGQQPQQRPQQPQPDARYAAPETQPGGPGGPGRRRQAPPEPPRRNGLLIGAIAVVLAVVVGVGAAILFSGDDTGDDTAGNDPTGSPSQDAGGNGNGNGDGGGGPSDGESTPNQDPGELPAADVGQLQVAGGAVVENAIGGASSPDGSYITGLNTPGASFTWTFDFQGEPGQYWLYTTYSAISSGQTLDFSLSGNGDTRDDTAELDDFNNTGEWDGSWTNTYNYIDLEPGEYTLTYTCSASCDAIVDRVFLSDRRLEL